MKNLKIIISTVALIGLSFFAFNLNAQTVSGTVSTKIKPKKSASLTLVSIEDGFLDPFADLVQNAHNEYTHCFKGYDKSVLLKRKWTNQIKPDVHIKNSLVSNFFSQLKKLADNDYFIDVYIFTHGNCNTIATEDGDINSDRITKELKNYKHFKGGKFPIRMIYQMNCYGATLNQEFIEIGAKAVVGTRYVNFYPNQFNKFAREWKNGKSFKTSVKNSNTTSSRSTMQGLIATWGLLKSGCPDNVLGKNDCSKKYFCNNWLCCRYDGKTDQWDNGKSGKENMNASSKMIISGDGQITKKSKPVWSATPSSTKQYPCNGCNDYLGSKSGVVYATPAGTFKPDISNNDEVKIVIKKTGGKAKTKVSVYDITGTKRKLSSYTFSNGNDNIGKKKTFILSGVKEQQLKVVIENNSLGNIFSYDVYAVNN